MPIPSDIRKTFGRTVGAGLAAAAITAGAAWGLERERFGADDAASIVRVEAEVRQRFDASAAVLGALASRAAADRDSIRSAGRDTEAAQRLFATLASAMPADAEASTGVTVYDAAGIPLAWIGRVVDLPRARLDASPALFVASDALGPRLVRIEPIVDRAGSAAARLGAVVAEQLLSDVQGVPDAADPFVLSGALVPVSLPPGSSARPIDSRDASPYDFSISSPDGQLLVEAHVSTADLAAARARWHGAGYAAVWAVLGLTLLACAAPLIDLRRRSRGGLPVAAATAGLVAIAIGGRIVVSLVIRTLMPEGGAADGFSLLADALMLVGLVWLALDLAERWRLIRPRALGRAGGAAVVGLYFAAGVVVGAGLWGYERFLRDLVNRTSLDLVHFSLHPLTASRVALSRVAISFSLVLLPAAVIWSGALVLRLVDTVWRPRRRAGTVALVAVGGAGGIAAGAVAGAFVWGPAPLVPFVVAAGAACACAAALSRPRGPFRRASQVARLTLFFLALLVPALAMYPSLDAFAADAKEQVVANTFAPQALNQRDDVLRQGERTLEQIDMMPGLRSLVEGKSDADVPTTDQAYGIWAQTALNENRITSAIELYAANGRLVSRFALNLPEYTVTSHSASSCQWVFFEEVSSFAVSDRQVLRATRGICAGRIVVGSVVVRMMLDYRILPFISSQRPYVESLRPEGQPAAETSPGRDVEFTVYGWSRAPLYTSGSGVWPLQDATFNRLLNTRLPFWTTLARDDGRTYRVYFVSNRGGIYALGYPTITLFGYLVNLAELISLTTVLWILLVGGATLFNTLTALTPIGGRALLREVRSSFYRKLWLAFVAVVVVPMLILAVLARTYFANQFRAGVEEDAIKTATVAQRLVEDYATLQQRDDSTPGGQARTEGLDSLDDQVMILVSQAIDQDVNLFDPKHLQRPASPICSRRASFRAAFQAMSTDRWCSIAGRRSSSSRKSGGPGIFWPRLASAPASAKVL